MQEKNSLRTVSIVRKLRILRRNLCKGKIPAWAEGDRYYLVTATDAVLRELRDYPRLESSKKTFLAFAVSDTIPDDADIREITDALIRAGGDEAFLRSFPMMRNVSALLKLHEQFGKQVCPPDYSMTIGLLHSTRKIDWEAVWRETSAVEKALLADPAGTYPRCTAESRQEYRNAVRKYARKRRFSEEEAAKKILQMAMETEGGELSDILFPKKQGSVRTAVPFLLTGMAAASACVTGYFLRSFGAVRAILSGILLFLPFYAFFREAANIAACRFGHRVPILRLETEHVPKAGKTLVVTAALLSGEKHDTELFSELERQYLRNREKEVRFGILADLGDADHVTEAADENVIGNAVGRIRALNQKYARDGAPFYLFLRPRTYAAGEKRFFGWERKRGAILSLVRYLRGKASPFSLIVGNEEMLAGTAYICTLDSDTHLPADAVRTMVSAMLHPANRPVIRDGRVVGGIGILQPAMAVTLTGAVETCFTLLCVGKGGTDPYTRYSVDGDRILYGEGSFCGKGLFSVDAYLSVLDGAFPEESVLSHDFLEGQYLHCMNFPEVTLSDRIPTGILSYFERQSRWIRGDTEALRFAFRYHRREDGKIIRNPIPVRGRLRIIDHAVSAWIPVSMAVGGICISFFGYSAGIGGLLWFAILSALFLRPLLLVCNVRKWKNVKRRFNGFALPDLCHTLRMAFFRIQFMAFEGWQNARAAVTALWRMGVTHKGLLEWITANEAERRTKPMSPIRLCRILWAPILLGTVLTVSGNPVSAAIGVIWLFSPLSAYYLSRAPKNTEKVPLTAEECAFCREEASAIWRFFSETVTEKTSYLPPDNLQWFPFSKPKTAERTSPTNIGLYFLACVAACDFSLISVKEMTDRLLSALGSLEKAETYRGHYYNWYRTDTLERIGMPYLSAVDSGNLACSALAAAGGARDYMEKDIRLAGVCARLETLAHRMDFSVFYEKKRKYLSLGFRTDTESRSEGCYDLYCSEARSAVYFAIAEGQIPAEAWDALGRPVFFRNGKMGVWSWSGSAFEYFMPSLWLSVPDHSFSAEILSGALSEQMRDMMSVMTESGKISVFGKSEGAYFSFDTERNFQYHPCGSPFLGLAAGLEEQKLCMPYASFLMLPTADGNSRKAIFENLKRLKALGMHGPFGYYEALDLTRERLGGGWAVVRSVMAHHLGMSMAALANTVFDGCFVRRFLTDARMEAAQGLLLERIPTDTEPAKILRFRKIQEDPVPAFLREKAAEIPVSGRKIYAVISNTHTKAAVSSYGDLYLTDGDTLISSADGRFPLQIAFLYEGDIYVPCRGWGSTGEASFLFSCDDICIRYTGVYTNGVKAVLAVRIPAEKRKIMFTFSLTKNGETIPCRVLFRFRPIFAKERAYHTHPAYSDLFLKLVKDHENEGILIRRQEKEKGYADPLLSVRTERIAVTECLCDGADIFAKAGEMLRAEVLPGYLGESALLPLVLFRGTCGGMGRITLDLDPDRKTNEDPMLAGKIHTEFRLLCGGIGCTDEVVSSVLSGIFTNGKTHLYDECSAGFPMKGEKPVWTKSALWKYGISGDLPILWTTVSDHTAGARLEKIVYAWKYLLISGIRSDLVLAIREEDTYCQPVGIFARKILELCGVSAFAGKERTGGIFLIPFGEAMRAGILYRAVWKDGKEEETGFSPLVLPVKRYNRPVRCTLNEEKVTVFAGNKSVPWTHILTNRTFGTMLADRSLGFTYFGNSRECRVTPWYGETTDVPRGERILLSFENGAYHDLCAESDGAVFTPDSADYPGTAASLSYDVRVTIPDRRKRKEVAVVLKNRGEQAVFLRVRYQLEPLFGVFPEDGEIVSYYVGRSGTLSFSSRSSDICFPYHAVVQAIGAEEASAGRAGERELFCEGVLTLPADGGAAVIFSLSVFHDGEKASEYVLPAEPTPRGKAIDTGSGTLDALYRTWLPVQTFHSRLWARCGYWQPGGAYGFRDQLQDAFNMLLLDAKTCKRQILACAAHQYTEGDVMHWWHSLPAENGHFHRGLRSRCSDDLLWLPFVLAEYVKETGDDSFPGTEVFYLESPVLADNERERYEEPIRSSDRESLYMHGIRAIGCVLQRGFGPHGLPFMGSGDWNDGMNEVGIRGNGESVWLGQFLMLVLSEYLPLCRLMGDDTGIEEYEETLYRLADALERDAWNGMWYRRAWYDDGTPMGEPDDTDAEIDLLPQAFAAIVNEHVRLPDGRKPFSEERVHRAMLCAYERLFDEKSGLFRLLSPPFQNKDGDPYPGYIAAYPPGIRENGGQYTHAAVWGAMGLYAVGERELGDRVLYALDPSRSTASVRQKEPYAVCGDILYADGRIGEGGWSQYTGAAGWYYRLLYERFGNGLSH